MCANSLVKIWRYTPAYLHDYKSTKNSKKAEKVSNRHTQLEKWERIQYCTSHIGWQQNTSDSYRHTLCNTEWRILMY